MIKRLNEAQTTRIGSHVYTVHSLLLASDAVKQPIWNRNHINYLLILILYSLLFYITFYNLYKHAYLLLYYLCIIMQCIKRAQMYSSSQINQKPGVKIHEFIIQKLYWSMFNSLTITLHGQNPEVEKENQNLTHSLFLFTIKDMFSSIYTGFQQ